MHSNRQIEKINTMIATLEQCILDLNQTIQKIHIAISLLKIRKTLIETKEG